MSENENLPPEPALSPEQPAPEPVKAVKLEAQKPEQKPKGSWLGRFFRHILSAETRTGRIVRPVLRVVGFIVAFYALGVLTVYLLMVQPARAEIRTLQETLARTTVELRDTQDKLQKVEKEVLDARKAEARSALLEGLYPVTLARLYVADRKISDARVALNQAEEVLKKAYPILETQKLADPKTLSTLIELTRADLGRDTRLAEQDLERLTSEILLTVEKLK